MDLVEDISSRITIIKDCAYKMKKERKKANSLETRDKAFAYCDNIIPIMEELRTAADQLEPLVDDELWPLVKYREMLFLR